MNETVVHSSGNVFADLGFPPDEAAVLEMRASLMVDLKKFIEAKKLSQSVAARRFGISQTRVADLVHGKWDKFSLEMLVTLATRAGMRVTLRHAA